MSTRHLLLALALLLTTACSLPVQRSSTHVDHLVICWLKQPGNAADLEAIHASAERLRAIPGVVDIVVSTPLASERAVVDASFDIAVRVVLRDSASLDYYQTHPIHLREAAEILRPRVSKVLIYDLQIR